MCEFNESHWQQIELDNRQNEYEWALVELETTKADNSDLERENLRMKWALSSRWTQGTYEGRTMFDEYKELTEEFWERQGL